MDRKIVEAGKPCNQKTLTGKIIGSVVKILDVRNRRRIDFEKPGFEKRRIIGLTPSETCQFETDGITGGNTLNFDAHHARSNAAMK